MKNYITISILLLLCFLFSCGQKSMVSSGEGYQKWKSMFDPRLVEHFPAFIDEETYYCTSETNLDKNAVSLYLYINNCDIEKIKALLDRVHKMKYTKYNSGDSCLFIVNRFETVESKKNRTVPQINSSKTELSCYREKNPIPNFIDYQIRNDNESIFKKNYQIFVIESKEGVFYNDYQKKMNPNMPTYIKNGYSRGYAISENEKAIIYWLVIW